MKKRLIPALATLLLIATLLCSCAEGLPLSEFALAFKDQTSTLATRVENLLTDNPPLAANGETDFAVLFDKSATEEVQSAVKEFCAQFQTYSGADLTKTDPDTAKGRILIGVADTNAAREILKGLSAASFYIGFADGDLLILAHNDIMLRAALTYFCENYLTADQATSAPRDVFWPSGLCYTSPTLSCEDDKYTLIRAEETGTSGVDAVSLFFETVYNKGGVRPVRKTDFNYKTTEREILLGYPNHPAATEILETLAEDEYYIGIKGTKILILAKNDLMLNKAVAKFISTFVSSPHATIEKKSKKIEFPAACEYYYREQTVTLAENGTSHAVLVYPENTGDLVRAALAKLCTLYKQLTNTELIPYADTAYERAEGVFEILVGRTNRSESQLLYFDGIDKGAWQFRMDADGKALVVGANGEFALKAAVEALGSALRTQTAALSREAIDDGWNLKDGKDRLLYLSLDFAQSGAEIPDLLGAYTYRLYTYSYMMQQKNATAAQYDEYCAVLAEAGLTLSPQDEGSEHRAVYQTNTRTVTVTYTAETRVLSVQVSTRWRR